MANAQRVIVSATPKPQRRRTAPTTFRETSRHEAEMASNHSPRQQQNLRPAWRPGQSGNPVGRPKGSRNKLSEAFLQDLQAHWQEHGKDAIHQVYKSRPHEYVKIVASLCPKELHIEQNALDSLADDEVLEALAVVRELIAQRNDAKVIDARPVDGNSGPSEASLCAIPTKPGRSTVN